tara:strand:+ start:1806 stop:1991 length:186 start_codon:yes stop_codon:yes gene_type:complete
MKFWRVTAHIKDQETPKVFIIQGPYDKRRTVEILKEVHPEYKKITMKSIKRPAWCKLWGEG